MTSEKSVLAVIRAARPTFRNRNDKIAFAVHSSFLASGYVLTATGPEALSEAALSNPSTDEVSSDSWNALNDDEYAFVYANPEEKDSSKKKKVLVKCLAMNDKLVVHAFREGFSEPLNLEINVADYAGEDGGSNYAQQFKNFENLVKRIDSEILSKLGFSETTRERTRQEIPDRDPVVGPPNHPSVFPFAAGPPNLPSGIIGGYGDLYPGPPAGVYPSIGGGDGMLLGPNDPRWLGGGVGGGFRGGLPGVPPGARFDPFGPIPGFEPNRFGDNTHPDLEHFRRNADSDHI